MKHHVIKVDLFSSKIAVIAMIYLGKSFEILNEGRDIRYLYTYIVHTCSKKILLAKTYRNNSSELFVFNSSCQNIKLFESLHNPNGKN